MARSTLRRTPGFAVAALVCLLLAGPAAAEEARAGDILVQGAMSRETAPGMTTGAAYLTLVNDGNATDRLVAASSPLAHHVMLHAHQVGGDGVARMIEADGGIELPPGVTVSLQPGGLHLMLMGLVQQLEPGSSLPLTLRFERAGELSLEVPVRPMRGGG
ncbi:MAG TPA: copper chaperone PCu(A)C [Geminicoccaceae bacterium]|nr:copper chaperone PCu(A)C [Geminicoccaceae bacterium]